MAGRLLVVMGVAALILLARPLYGAWRRRAEADPRAMPAVPQELVEGAERTWVVFTTPYCATCRTVTERLSADHPDARVVTVDATRHRELAGAFSVRTAPTVLLADAAGRVLERFVSKN